MGEIGVAVIGAGYMGKCHAMAYTAAAGTFDVPQKPRLEMICDVDRKNAEASATLRICQGHRRLAPGRDLVIEHPGQRIDRSRSIR